MMDWMDGQSWILGGGRANQRDNVRKSRLQPSAVDVCYRRKGEPNVAYILSFQFL